MGTRRPQVPALSIEMVMEELAGLPMLENRQAARAFLVLQRERTRVFISTVMEDAERQLENLMTEQWIPLGFITYSAESPKAVTRCLTWYLELLKNVRQAQREKPRREIPGNVLVRKGGLEPPTVLPARS